MKVIHRRSEHTKHDWYRNKDGEIDIWAVDVGYHNGPMCRRCGFSFCEHCNPDGYNDTNCVVDWNECPQCGNKLSDGSKFCPECGTRLDWE